MMLRKPARAALYAAALYAAALIQGVRPVHAATQASPPGAASEEPRVTAAPTPWLLRAGFLSRALLLPIAQPAAPDLSYWPNHTNLVCLTAGYRGFVLGVSISAGESNAVATHGTSSGLDLRMSLPVEVARRQLFLSGTVQDYRGFFLQEPSVATTPLVREDMGARHIELAASYILDRDFDYSGDFVQLNYHEGVEHSPFLRTVGSVSTVHGEQPLVPAEYAEEYGASAQLSAVDSYALHALAGYAVHLAWASLFANGSLALGINGALAVPGGGNEPSRLSAGPAMQFAFALGLGRENWHLAMFFDGSAHEVRLREMGMSWLPIQASFVFGVRF